MIIMPEIHSSSDAHAIWRVPPVTYNYKPSKCHLANLRAQ